MPIPVVDGLTVATKMVEALVGCGLRTSKHGDLAYPIPKPFVGAFARFAVRPRQPVPMGVRA